MWREIIETAISAVKTQLQVTLEEYNSNVNAMNASPSRMEARYDVSREEYSRLAAISRQNVDAYKRLLQYLTSLTGNRRNHHAIVDFGSVVKIQYITDSVGDWLLIVRECGGLEFKYHSDTIHIVSSESPIGRTLLRSKVGNIVSITGSGQQIRVLILIDGDEQL